MKIKRIEVKNYKAVSEQQINLNGCSAIVTAANDKGKTSILTGLVDRLRSDKPEIIVKEGEDKGFNSIELTDGSKIEWNFTNKSERLSYTTSDGIKQTTGVISAIGEKYFGKQFDIDAFLNSTPKQQEKQLQDITGVDLDEIEERYKKAYEERTEKNKELKRIRAKSLEKPEEVEKPDVEPIKEELKEERHKKKAKETKQRLEQLKKTVNSAIEGTPFVGLFNEAKADAIIEGLNAPEDITIDELEENISEIEQRLEEANKQIRKHDAYERDLEEYKQWVEEGKKAKKEAQEADEKVKSIEKEKQQAIAEADFPEGFGIDDNGLTYNGFPLSEKQISTSSKYIAALKLGAMVLGKVKTLHFDASSLDNNSLDKVQDWAQEKGLQLLIERPDLDGGEIKYELIQNGQV